MLPTFVIGLREGLEAALIVGIIAAFLRKQGRRDLLRWVLIGVGSAIVLCVAAGIALEVYSANLPQRQQEGLETVIGALAVGMVTYMVVWMRRNARQLKSQLEGMAADAMTGRANAGRAMVLMAFLAVIREGLETVVFLLAAFNESGSGSAAGAGATLGILVAVALGYGLYRGGVRLNLSKFFRGTGLVLVLVAAGLVVNALHTAHEAGWLNIGQGGTVDLSWLVQPGTVQASLLTGMLGIQDHPVVIEVVGWLLYLIPVGLYVAWPPGKAVPARALARVAGVAALLTAVAAVLLAALAPAAPAARPTTSARSVSAQVNSRDTSSATVRTEAQDPVHGTVGAAQEFRLPAAGRARHDGVDADVFRIATDVPTTDLPTTLSLDKVAQLNGGRLPIGLVQFGASAPTDLTAAYRGTRTLTVWLDTRTDRVLDLAWTEQIALSVRAGDRTVALDRPYANATSRLPATAARAAVASANAAHTTIDDRSRLHTLAAWCAVLAVLALLVAAAALLAARRRAAETAVTSAEPTASLVRS
ncbi:iron uptake transporter permease EfeU [uncultured Jatrophihabitans sp.]|uniref:iron uptake transporter permease EfeU n=1 Tax=uncultured Jatrophihabitans sp. TaxID=1610747 RepID=UPI0035CC91BC